MGKCPGVGEKQGRGQRLGSRDRPRGGFLSRTMTRREGPKAVGAVTALLPRQCRADPVLGRVTLERAFRL